MDLRSAIIINNEPVAATSLPSRKIKDMVDYVSREGRFAIGGCDGRLTADDARLTTRSDVGDMVDYLSREGRFEYRKSKDAPLIPDEISGGLWGRHGPISGNAWKKLVRESGSHVMRSVVAVRREDAKELGLTSKEDWQRAIRATWDSYVRSWGVISPSDIEWAAAYHVDNKQNLHVHIMTIDASGKWARHSPDIPHERFVGGLCHLREEFYRPLIVREEAEASALRDWMCARMRAVMDRPEVEREMALFEKVSRVTDIELPLPSMSIPDREMVRRAASELLRARPDGDERVLSYARLSAEGRKAAIRMVEQVREKDLLLERAYRRYEVIQHDKAITRGYTGIDTSRGYPIDREEYAVKQNMIELNKRLANAGLTGLRKALRTRSIHVREHGAQDREPVGYCRSKQESGEQVQDERDKVTASAHLSLGMLAKDLAREFAMALARSPYASASHIPSSRVKPTSRERNTHRKMSETRMSER